MKKNLLILTLSMMASLQAQAFDRLYCQSSLKGWIISSSNQTRDAILTPQKSSGTFTQKQASELVLIGDEAETLLTVFPWNSLYVRTHATTKTKYNVFTQESKSGFVIELQNKINKSTRSFACRYTF
ncbi:hypothetical protein [Bdellovibrio sp. NC01]|uniref:hypothetical protein n=1 Tax=Bdellovibrio sp. NC01 TaxID=2220073 RepID=UPI001159B83A|nr:hypothetical protein [Bdellovibrio sp. NC01]QDK38174.1 hypothetical protein DOE51_11565 [Bdellovibrio sp. NC01]